jgi:hypothetical protein
LLDSQQGDKEQADVVIDLLGIGLIQAASGTALRRIIQSSRFGLNPGNEKTHTVFPQGPRKNNFRILRGPLVANGK